jgi:putative membrane protein
MRTLLRLVLEWVITALALAAADLIVPGVEFRTMAALAVGALVLAHLNTRLRPLLMRLGLGITWLTVGLFSFVIDGLLLALTAAVVPGFGISSFWAAIGGAVIVAPMTTVFDRLMPAKLPAQAA